MGNCSPFPGLNRLAAVSPKVIATIAVKKKYPNVVFQTRCIFLCVRKLATPTAIEVNTNGIITIFNKSTNNIPSNSAIYRLTCDVADSLSSIESATPKRMPESEPIRI